VEKLGGSERSGIEICKLPGQVSSKALRCLYSALLCEWGHTRVSTSLERVWCLCASTIVSLALHCAW
jgi:hypothetical protein